MDLIFLIIFFLILVIILFVFNRIVWKSTIWSSLMAALWWSLIIILLVQVFVPCDFHDNRSGVVGVIIVIFIVLVYTTVYITDMMIRDTDIKAVLITDRNVILW